MLQCTVRPFRSRAPGREARFARPLRRLRAGLLAAVLASGAAAQEPSSGPAEALFRDASMGKLCTSTAMAARLACQNDVEDDYWTSVVTCNNLAERGARSACLAEAQAARTEGRERCAARFEAHYDLCATPAEAPMTGAG